MTQSENWVGGEVDGDDDFFTDLENNKPYVKIGLEGFAGSGKSFTSAHLALGLYKRIGSKKPLCFFDTEHSAKFFKPLFREHGIRILHKESRSLADLVEAMKRGRSGLFDVLVIDSITHVWEDFTRAYQKKKNRNRLQFEDWGVIKPLWKAEFAEPFVRDPLHIIMTGRAGYEYEDEKDEDGKRQIYKAGIKMKAEGETAYEPDLLILMARHEDVIGKEKSVWREATILKDRSTLIDGRTFRDPTFEDLAPAIDFVLDDPAARGLPTNERDAGSLVKGEEDKREWFRKRDIALEEIEGFLTSCFPGQSADAKKAKVDALEKGFGTRSWKAIEKKRPEELDEGLAIIKMWVEQMKMENAS